MTSHNANLVVLSDPECIAVFEAEGGHGKLVSAGFLSHRSSNVSSSVLDILDGSDRALQLNDDWRAIDVGKCQCRVEIRLCRRAIADPYGRDLGVTLDGRRHRKAHRLDLLRGQIPGNREKSPVAIRLHHRQLPPLERIVLV